MQDETSQYNDEEDEVK